MLHERHDREAEGRRLLAPLDDAAHPRRRDLRAARLPPLAARRDPARSCRCSTRTRGAIRTWRRCSARSRSIPARTSTRRACSTPSSRRRSRRPPACRRSGSGSSQMLDAEPDRWDLSALKAMLVGGSAAPRAMIAGFKQRHGLTVDPRLGHDRDLAGREPLRPLPRSRRRRRGGALRLHRQAGPAAAARRAPRARRRGERDPVGRRDDGRARDPRPVGRLRLLRHARAGRPVDRRRLVPDRRHRLARPARLHPDPGPDEGRDQVGRRVDLVGRARERADGPPGRGRGGRDRDPGPEVAGAAARRRRAARGEDRDRRGAARLPGAAASRSGGCPSGSSSWTRSRRPRSASSGRPRCARCSRARPREGARHRRRLRDRRRARRAARGRGLRRRRLGPRERLRRRRPRHLGAARRLLRRGLSQRRDHARARRPDRADRRGVPADHAGERRRRRLRRARARTGDATAARSRSRSRWPG